MKNLLIIFFSFLIAPNVFTQETKEEYRVYEAVIKHMFAGDKVTFDTREMIKQIVIRDQTTNELVFPSKKWERIKTQLGDKVSDEIIRNYEAVHDQPTKLTRSFDLSLKYSLLTKTEYDAIFASDRNSNRERDNWSHFYEMYPNSGGYIMLSNIGFSKAKDQALVYFVHWCGGLCGTGHYVLLDKKEKGWEVLVKSMIWIS